LPHEDAKPEVGGRRRQRRRQGRRSPDGIVSPDGIHSPGGIGSNGGRGEGLASGVARLAAAVAAAGARRCLRAFNLGEGTRVHTKGKANKNTPLAAHCRLK
jgi:hypothetical protein